MAYGYGSNSSVAVMLRCDSCRFDLSKSRTAYCNRCDISFDADINGESDDGGSVVCCSRCRSSSDIVVMRDEPTLLCKYCQNAASDDAKVLRSNMAGLSLAPALNSSQLRVDAEDSSNRAGGDTTPSDQGPMQCNKCGTSAENMLPVMRAKCTINCANCRQSFEVTNDYAFCPTCAMPAGDFDSLRQVETASWVCRLCVTLTDPQDSDRSEQASIKPWMQNYSNELWRFVGCPCDNQEPDCFDLQKAQHRRKSMYCHDCDQPYSNFQWDSELPEGQCPRCNGARVTEDVIDAGEDVIVCMKCDAIVPKRRFDDQLDQIRQAVVDELEAEPQSSSKAATAHQQSETTVCVQCGSDRVELAATWHNGDICLMQICDACGSAHLLAEWDAMGGAGHQQQLQQQRMQPVQTPAGFEELTKCCMECNMTKLHPVENDSDDVLLVCSQCQKVVSLDNCTGPRIPKTVSELRRILKGTFSSGEMGLPKQSVKVHHLTELKSGDHLEFRRTLYSHHGIAIEKIPDKGELAVIEYTGQSDVPTVLACLGSGPGKAHVARTLLKFKDIVSTLHRIDYYSLDCFQPSAVVRRALSRKYEPDYHFGRNNCEHLSIWAKTDLDLSRQVDAFKNKWRKCFEHPAVDAVLSEAKTTVGMVSKRPVGIIFDAIDDVRQEFLHLLRMEKNASKHILRTILRLTLKWGIRGLPFVVSTLVKCPVPMSVLLRADEMIFNPLATYAADKLLPIEDEEGCKK